MNETATRKFVHELGEVEHAELKATYCKLQEIRSVIHAMHDGYVTQGTPPDIARVEAAYLLMEELYDGLERFLLPLCSEEESCGPTICT
jgi:hypothetical protein